MNIYSHYRKGDTLMYADYHVHCEYSDDSRTPMKEQIETGIRRNLSEICFTDHVDYGVKKDWSEGNITYRNGDGVNGDPAEKEPIANVDYPKYFAELKKQKAAYQNRITVKAGLEFGVQTHTVSRYEQLYETWKEDLDFVLLSIHQIHDLELWNQDFQNGKTQAEYNRAYYRELYEVMKQFHHWSVLAHLDLITRYDMQGVYPFEEVEDDIAEILKLAIREGKGIEINTSCWHYGLADTQPSRRILRLYHDLGGTILTTGSDAHIPSFVADHFADAHRILKEAGFESFCTFDRMEPRFHPLEG